MGTITVNVFLLVPPKQLTNPGDQEAFIVSIAGGLMPKIRNKIGGLFTSGELNANRAAHVLQHNYQGTIRPPLRATVSDSTFSSTGSGAWDKIKQIARVYADLARIMGTDTMNVLIIAEDEVFERIRPLGPVTLMNDGEIRCLRLEAGTASRAAPQIVSDELVLRADD